MSVKCYQLFCDLCSYKRITDGTDIGDLREVKTSPIPRGAPQLDPQARQVNTPSLHGPAVVSGGTVYQPPMQQQKRFKCPKCGHTIKARQIQKTEHIVDEANNPDGRETGTSGQSLPGQLTN